ncbi:unnamed protein product [Cyprideis torosa]|uniref:Uncharacterized protein n=1 Tax=Cyprideis torosa TaxID=163714 RepID=A0A7R8ZRD3_9CRUS|nr:unnamed protein product [Cyprideis torosa]CAG0892774.1 unnamed protein product [Cyprideis torosa]
MQEEGFVLVIQDLLPHTVEFLDTLLSFCHDPDTRVQSALAEALPRLVFSPDPPFASSTFQPSSLPRLLSLPVLLPSLFHRLKRSSYQPPSQQRSTPTGIIRLLVAITHHGPSDLWISNASVWSFLTAHHLFLLLALSKEDCDPVSLTSSVDLISVVVRELGKKTVAPPGSVVDGRHHFRYIQNKQVRLPFFPPYLGSYPTTPSAANNATVASALSQTLTWLTLLLRLLAKTFDPHGPRASAGGAGTPSTPQKADSGGPPTAASPSAAPLTPPPSAPQQPTGTVSLPVSRTGSPTLSHRRPAAKPLRLASESTASSPTGGASSSSSTPPLTPPPVPENREAERKLEEKLTALFKGLMLNYKSTLAFASGRSKNKLRSLFAAVCGALSSVLELASAEDLDRGQELRSLLSDLRQSLGFDAQSVSMLLQSHNGEVLTTPDGEIAASHLAVRFQLTLPFHRVILQVLAALFSVNASAYGSPVVRSFLPLPPSAPSVNSRSWRRGIRGWLWDQVTEEPLRQVANQWSQNGGQNGVPPVTLTLRPGRVVSAEALRGYILLFEPTVINAMQLFSAFSDARLQAAVLDLLSFLIRLKVNYNLLDADRSFFNLLSKRMDFMEYADDHLASTLLPSLTRFFLLLSHQSLQPKGQILVKVPQLLQILNTLLASGRNPETHCEWGLIRV